MSTVFEMIIAGQIPGKFVWEDQKVVAFATIEPVSAGHTLVVPRQPAPKWTDLSVEAWAHLAEVAQTIGQAAEVAFGVPRATLVIAGFEVPHTHLHVIPARSEADCSLANSKTATNEELVTAMTALRETLRTLGHRAHVPENLNAL